MQDCDAWAALDARTLRGWPLPVPARDTDKEVRGRVLIVAGSREIPGAAVLAATAALRAGAGKLVIATGESVATHLAFAVPEARVIALPETPRGAFSRQGLDRMRAAAQRTDAALIGPGLMDEEGSTDFIRALLPLLTHAPVVLDALAMNVLKDRARLNQPLLFTPHAGEMAHLTDRSKQEIVAAPEQAAVSAARKWNCTVALKGATTLIATPSGGRWRHAGGQPGLATSGSGDVLAGLIAGLLAQGAGPEQACAWSVVLHACAGALLAARQRPLGYLARELPAQIPALMKRVQRRSRLKPPEREPTE
jgi:ADP-dependent NAD(P)H-hydrate dehydratase